jgi:LPXTG-motif cell wall-anchored protein
MRRLFATLTMVAMIAAAGLAVAGSAIPAGAQALTCTFTLSTTTLDGPGTVQVSGTAPASTELRILVDGVTVATVTTDPVTGAFGPVAVQITTTSTVSIALPVNYATLPCTGVGNVEVERAPQVVSLPRTGSDTSQYVLAALAAIGVGLVLVVATKRRRDIHSRA